MCVAYCAGHRWGSLDLLCHTRWGTLHWSQIPLGLVLAGEASWGSGGAQTWGTRINNTAWLAETYLMIILILDYQIHSGILNRFIIANTMSNSSLRPSTRSGICQKHPEGYAKHTEQCLPHQNVHTLPKKRKKQLKL